MYDYKERNSRRTPEYRAWDNMIQRCYNPKYIRTHRYKGRNIRVCDRWLDSFDNFLEDMGERPNKNYSLDRINNDGNYEPSNCKWSTAFEQLSNSSMYLKSNNLFPGIRTTVWLDGSVHYLVTAHFSGKYRSIGCYTDIEEAVSAKLSAVYSR